MFGIISSALAQFANFLISKAAVTAVLFAGLYWIITVVAATVFEFSGVSGNGFQSITSLSNFASGNQTFLYFSDVFQLWKGLKMILSAYAVRFLVRRIPVFG